MIQLLSRLLIGVGPFIVVTLVMRFLWMLKEKRDAMHMEEEIKKELFFEESKQQSYDYEIKCFSYVVWIMVPVIVFSAFCLCMAIRADGVQLYQLICVGGVALGSITSLHVFVWHVRVTGNDIEFRSTFGIKHHYRFEDITRGVYGRGGELRIYVGRQRIFTFDPILAFGAFERQMKKQGIPIDKTAIEGKKKRLYESDTTYPHKKKKKKKR